MDYKLPYLEYNPHSNEYSPEEAQKRRAIQRDQEREPLEGRARRNLSSVIRREYEDDILDYKEHLEVGPSSVKYHSALADCQ